MTERVSEPYGQPSVLEKIGFIPIFLRSFCVATYTGLTAPLRDNYGANTLVKAVTIAMGREVMAACNVRMMQYVSAPTDDTYAKLCKQRGFQPDTDILSDGAKAHWIGRKSAKKVFMYLHGGGYCLPFSDLAKEWIWDLLQTLNKGGEGDGDFAIVLLSYGLAPQSQYPTQLKQAVAMLRYLVEDQKRDPSDIFVGGDSAGGHLTVSLFSHLLHPHPAVAPLSLPSPLKGAVLISPWVSFETTAPSFAKNSASDFCSRNLLNGFVGAFVGAAPRDAYLAPLSASGKWWDGLERVVGGVFIWGGGGEILADPIRELGKNLGAHVRDTTTLVEPRSCHEEIVIDCTMGYPKAQGQLALESWIKERL